MTENDAATFYQGGLVRTFFTIAKATSFAAKSECMRNQGTCHHIG